MTRNTDLARSLCQRSAAAIEVRRFDVARQLAVDAIGADPEFGDGFASLGRALWFCGDFQEAEKSVREALHLNARDTWYLMLMAYCQKSQGQFNAALATLEQCLEIDPSDDKAFVLQGNTLLDLKRPGLAQGSFEKGLAINANSADALLGMTRVYFEKKRYVKAESFCRQALRLNPNSANLFEWLGACLENQFKQRDAALAFKTSLLIDPNRPYSKTRTRESVSSYLNGSVRNLAVIGIVTMLVLNWSSWSIVAALLCTSFAIWSVFIFIQRAKRIANLKRQDPQLLEIYETLKRDSVGKA